MATRRPQPGEPVYPLNLERQLFGVMDRWAAFLTKEAAAMTSPADGDRVRAAFRRRYPASVQRAEIRRVLALVSQHTVRDLERLLGVDVPDVDVEPRALLDELLDSISTLVEDTVRLRSEELERSVSDSFIEWAQRAAARLARRAVTYARFAVTRAAAAALGAPEYTWRTQRDERVRSSHAALDGRAFNWLTGSPVGHPGQPYGCRCFAVPHLPAPRGAGLLPPII